HSTPVVTAGTAEIQVKGTTTTIQQGSDRAVLEWSEFNLPANHSVEFIVPSSTSATLNRIQSDSPSRIAGTISSNGLVYLVNPNGLVFEASSRLSVNGLVATTANVTSFDFMQRTNLPPDHGSGRIELNGRIDAASVTIRAETVVVNGQISAPSGRIELSSTNLSTIGQQAVISANSNQPGDSGGWIKVWSDNHTDFRGMISAKGGASCLAADCAAVPAGASGGGGWVEVSGKQTLNFAGTVTTEAPNGKAGTLLLDPAHVEIVETAGTDPAVTYVQVAELVQALNNNNVTIDAISGTEIGIAISNWRGSDGVITVASAINSRANPNSHSLTLIGTEIKIEANITLKGDLTLTQSGNSTNYGLSIANATVAAGGNLRLQQNGSSSLVAIHIESSSLTAGGDLSLTQSETASSGNSGIYLAASNLSAVGNLSLRQSGRVGGSNPGLHFFAQSNFPDKGVSLSAGSDKWVTIRSSNRNLRLGNRDQFSIQSGRLRLDLGSGAVESLVGPIPSGGYSLNANGVDVYFTGDRSGSHFKLEIGSGSFTAVTTTIGDQILSPMVNQDAANYGWVFGNGAAIAAVGVGFATSGTLTIDTITSRGYEYLEGQQITGAAAVGLSSQQTTPLGSVYYLQSKSTGAEPLAPAPKPVSPVANPPTTPPTVTKTDETPTLVDLPPPEVPINFKLNDPNLLIIVRNIVNEISSGESFDLNNGNHNLDSSSGLFTVASSSDTTTRSGTTPKNLLAPKLKAILTPIPNSDPDDESADFYAGPNNNTSLWD
ncbi:MAG: filamentous hemagglutinin N-terminal domain-containing protein, partial [Alphaproteobacteria bacterium]|nr:filamentous hemagglutinin N-terminal domain-containing protein [Alphaproteobacteria bacterium]